MCACVHIHDKYLLPTGMQTGHNLSRYAIKTELSGPASNCNNCFAVQAKYNANNNNNAYVFM